MIKKYALLFALLLNSVFAFNQTIAGWDFTGLNTVATATATVFDANLVSTSNANLITRGAGAAASAGNNSFRTVGFQNNGIALTNTDYFQITLNAATGYALSIQTIDARFAGTASFAASPGVSHQFAYSLDGTNFTFIAAPSTTIGSPATLSTINTTSILDLQNVPSTTTVTLRYFASGQTTTGGWGFNSPSAGTLGLSIGGTVSLASGTPSISFDPLTLPNSCIGSSTTINTIVSGSNLDGSDVILGPYADFSFSNSASGPFDPTLILSYLGSTLLPTPVFVKYTPSASGPMSANIALAGGGASSSVLLSSIVHDLPTVLANANDNVFCEGESVIFSGSGAASYVWSGGISDNTPFAATQTTTTYSVVGTDANGCSNTNSITITVNPLPVLSINQTPLSACYGISRTLTATGADSYSWTGGISNGLAFVNLSPTTYTVTGTDNLGCSNTASYFVDVNSYNGLLAGADLNNSSTFPGPYSETMTYDQPDNSQLIFTNQDCMVMLCITDALGGNVLGNTTASVNVEASTPVYNGQPYVSRWWEATPTNNGSAVVTLFLTQDDFDEYNLNNGSFPDLPTSGSPTDTNIANIRVTKVDGVLGTGIPTVITPTVLWNATFNYWILDFPVTGFSRFYVHAVNPGNVPLPLRVTSFSGENKVDGIAIQWESDMEQHTTRYTLQHSLDGEHFNTIYQSDAVHALATSKYSFMHTNAVPGHNYYRLVTTDMDGKTIIHEKQLDILRAEENFMVKVFPVQCSDVLHLTMYAPKATRLIYQLQDLTGKTLLQQDKQLVQGHHNMQIPVQELAQGMYVLQLYQNGKRLLSEKIIKY